MPVTQAGVILVQAAALVAASLWLAAETVLYVRRGRRGADHLARGVLAVAVAIAVALAAPLAAVAPGQGALDPSAEASAGDQDGLGGATAADPAPPRPPPETPLATATPTSAPSRSPETNVSSSTAEGPVDLDRIGAGDVARNYSWMHDGRQWRLDISMPGAAVDAYKDRDRAWRLIDHGGTLYRQAAYDVYVSDPSDDAYIAALATRFAEVAADEGWDRPATAAFVLGFIQSLRYTPDSVLESYDEYPRYPLETLADEGGDCEDTSILYASILLALGIPALLVAPGDHMAVAVGAPEGTPGAGYQHAGGWYLYAETTGDGWTVGEMPPDLSGLGAQTFDLEPRSLLDLKVTIGGVEGTRQQVTIQATNVGSKDTTAASAVATLHDSVRTYDEETCSWGVVPPRGAVRCSLWVELAAMPPGVQPQLRVVTLDDGNLHDRAQFR